MLCGTKLVLAGASLPSDVRLAPIVTLHIKKSFLRKLSILAIDQLYKYNIHTLPSEQSVYSDNSGTHSEVSFSSPTKNSHNVTVN